MSFDPADLSCFPRRSVQLGRPSACPPALPQAIAYQPRPSHLKYDRDCAAPQCFLRSPRRPPRAIRVGSLIRVVPASRETPRLIPARAATAVSLPCQPTRRDARFSPGRCYKRRPISQEPTLQKSFGRSFPNRATHGEPLPYRCRRRRFDQRAPGFRKRPHSSAVCSKRMRRRVRPKSIMGNCSAFAASA